MDKSKASWDRRTTELLLKEVIEQIYQRQRKGTSLTKVGWKNVEIAFKAKSGKRYDKKQLKNRYDSLKRDWNKWEELLKETGIGWDPTTKTVVAPDEWWEKKKKENREYEKFRYNGLPFAKELETIFKGVSASGKDQLTPSLTPQDNEDEDDVYRPNMDLLEGSGDSEEDDFGGGSAGFTDELAGVNLTSSNVASGPSDSGSLGKRKRNEVCGKGKKIKVPASKQIADSVSVIATASQDRVAAMKKLNETSMTDVTAELLRFEEIQNDDELMFRCMEDFVVNKNFREIFMGMKGKPEVQLKWVRKMARDPPSWLQPPPS